jgi:hypothetical protein
MNSYKDLVMSTSLLLYLDVQQTHLRSVQSRLQLFSDSVYSERYMGQPGLTGNFKGYEVSSTSDY